jgi:tripartite-type tricarboxylate transporter receptor subunit TctC
MLRSRRIGFCVLALVIALAPATRAVAAYPDRPIHLIVPYPAGGGADHWGRLVAEKLAASLGQPIIVENIAGRGGNNGTAVAAKGAPDGYTLLLGSVGPLAVHPYTYASLPFDPQRDFVPVALLESSPILLVASPAAHVTSLKDLLERARTKPASLSYASNGNGSPEQVAGEVFKTRLGIALTHLPYDGAGPARKAVLAGEAALMFDPCKGALPAVREGLQLPLAVAAPKRLEGLPDVPTFAEVGLPQYELRIWTGVLAPAGTSAAIVRRLNEAVRAVLMSPEIVEDIRNEGGETGVLSPKGFSRFIAVERQHWSALVRESGVGPVS